MRKKSNELLDNLNKITQIPNRFEPKPYQKVMNLLNGIRKLMQTEMWTTGHRLIEYMVDWVQTHNVWCKRTEPSIKVNCTKNID